jgi:hypothetical protein
MMIRTANYNPNCKWAVAAQVYMREGRFDLEGRKVRGAFVYTEPVDGVLQIVMLECSFYELLPTTDEGWPRCC